MLPSARLRTSVGVWLVLATSFGLALGAQQTSPTVDAEWPWDIPWVIEPGVVDEDDGPPRLNVENHFGGIGIEVRDVSDLKLSAAKREGPAQRTEITVRRAGTTITVRASPRDDQPIDLSIVVPYRRYIHVETTDGPIEYHGFGTASFKTRRGLVALSFPAEATTFDLASREPPGFFEGEARITQSAGLWSARDTLAQPALAYGRLTLQADRPAGIQVAALADVPADSPVKPHWRAAKLLPRLFRRYQDRGRANRNRAQREGEPDAESTADFSAEVRLAQFDVSVTDKHGNPVLDLGADDFEISENGEPQQLVDLSRTEEAFNLALLLDCSSSTEQDRPAIEQAARNFLRVAKDGDRVGLYALADTYFQVLSPLTHDFDAVRNSAIGIEKFGGATPLHDAAILAYAEELAALPRERNALVVISDGLDNSIYQIDPGGYGDTRGSFTQLSRGVPSAVPFSRLLKASQEMRALIYPIVLDPVKSVAGSRPFLYERAQQWSRTVDFQMRKLAEATGGRIFRANSIEDLDDVYARVAADLRSVYTLTYRPANQDFDGDWRRVRVKVRRPTATVRGRPGYFAY